MAGASKGDVYPSPRLWCVTVMRNREDIKRQQKEANLGCREVRDRKSL